MLKEAIEYVMAAGRSSANRIVKADAEPSHVYYLADGTGELQRVEAARPPMAGSKAFSLQAVVKLAEDAESAAVWYSPASVACEYGDDDRRNRITLDLVYSEPFLALVSLKKSGKAMTQAEIIRMMRTTFRDSLSQAGQLVQILEKVNFKATAEIEGVVQHGKASLGKSITGQVTGTTAIPEYVTFNFQMFAMPCFKIIRGTVECALIPDAGTGTFQIVPLPGQLEEAQDTAVNEIGNDIAGMLANFVHVAVYHGNP